MMDFTLILRNQPGPRAQSDWYRVNMIWGEMDINYLEHYHIVSSDADGSNLALKFYNEEIFIMAKLAA